MGKRGKREHGTSRSYSPTKPNVKVVPDERYSNFNRYRKYSPDSTYRKQENTAMNNRYDRSSGHTTKTSDYQVISIGRGRHKKYVWKKSKPTTSPAHLGSEEHTMQKIKQTSAIIMRQILNPEENIIAKSIQDNSPNNSLESMKEQEINTEKTPKNTSKISKNKSKEHTYSVEEIHNKIMYHLTNLNKGKKRNLINSNSTGYDEPIQQIMKQKRLEISRALRNMCSDDNDPKSTDFINSIIPDMGIKIEDLPQDFLEELRHSFDFSIQNGFPMMNNYYPEMSFNTEMCQPPAYDNLYDFPTTSNEFSDTGNVPPPNFFHFNVDAIDPTEQLYNEAFDSRVRATEDNLSSPFKNDDIIWIENVSSANPNVHQFSEEISHNEELSHNVKSEVKEDIPEIHEPISTTNTTIYDDYSSDQCNEIMNTKDSHQLQPSTSISNVNPKIGADFTSDKCIFSQSTNETANTESNQTNPGNNISNPVSNDMRDFEAVVHNESQKSRLDINNMSDIEEPSSSTELHIPKETDEANQNIVEIRKEDIYNESQYNLELKKECEESCEDKKDFSVLNLGTDEVMIKEDEVMEVLKAREYSEASTQTLKKRRMSMKFFLKQAFPKPPSTINVAVRRMSYIDDYISDLIDYRKKILSKYIAVERLPVIIQKRNVKNERKGKSKKNENKKNEERVAKKRKNSVEKESNVSIVDTEASDKVDMIVKKRKNNLTDDNSNPNSSVVEIEETVEKSSCSDAPVNRLIEPQVPVQNMLVFKEMKESFLDLKVFEDKLMAATESGNIVFFSLEDGRHINNLKVSKKPISCLVCLQAPDEKMHICVGSFDGFLKVYNFYSQCLLRTIKLSENAQCMECNWDYLFIGGSKGSIFRYSMKKRAIEYEDKFYDDCIFVLKATQEGARRVLLIGSRNSPVVIRDAINGLHLRTMQDLVCPTVYSLVIQNNMVYCGTTNLDILVFNFHNGRLEHKLKAAIAKGIGCLKTFGRLLFASCHNGNVYVYNTEKNTFIGIMDGPGGVITSMEVIVNQVVVGTLSLKFVSLPIPEHILKQK
ncbi:unnamed protein product [Phaedon cochleariae]|uniref:Uncharacterized protein n=1 Tax=Phaedon cochleariae TaxID=80249 RepID=A0A9P0DCU6_PHACE|nr:unnamed protein product [Phaedon cochleariae]